MDPNDYSGFDDQAAHEADINAQGQAEAEAQNAEGEAQEVEDSFNPY